MREYPFFNALQFTPEKSLKKSGFPYQNSLKFVLVYIIPVVPASAVEFTLFNDRKGVSKMIERLHYDHVLLLCSSILLQFLGKWMNTLESAPLSLTGAGFMIIATILFFWGCVSFSQSKGYSGWLGLLGFLSCLGLLIIWLLPDRNS